MKEIPVQFEKDPPK